MFKAKSNKMTIKVEGVKAEDSRELMKEIVRRNCKVDPRIIDSMVNYARVSGENGHEVCDYYVRLENYDFGGIVNDFELLKKAGAIKQVVKTTCYIVY